MKIKKISIHGFKSFVDKATLNFSSGTSGIICPHGCGKPNIVDAIRWVIGEQNPRHLRGKLMEDVIFTGSETRKPLGMAEVMLTFSNEDGQAPARFKDYSEIEVGRRLYRSGESEYYLNKVQCRLRDVVDVFTDTGVGTKAYSIVEQGQVAWLINAKPEERRVIFEEAAGINKYRQKKEAALRKLEATRENLTRVNDIISEVKRQLNSLNRQAKKAERYKALREELKRVDLNLTSREFRKLSDELSSALKRLEELKDGELMLTSGVSSREAQAEGIKVECLRAEEDFKAIRDRVFGLEKEIQAKEQENTLASMRLEEIKRNEERLKSEIDEHAGALSSLLNEMEGLKASVGSAQTLMDEEEKRAERLQNSLEGLVTELKGREERVRGEEALSLGIMTRLSDIKHSLQALLKDEEYSRIREAKAGSEKEEASRLLSSREEPARLLKGKISAATANKGSIDAETALLKEKSEILEHERTARIEEIRTLKEDYAKASARLSMLEEMERNLEAVEGGGRAVMWRTGRDGVHCLLADVIETNQGYEQAVEAAMGTRLQYVIVESQREGVEAIEYLKKSLGGRGSFIPVRDTSPATNPVTTAPASYAYPGAKELLSEVRVKDGYETIVSYLLGDIIVVDTLEAALDMWRANGIYKTIVTLEGEVIDPQGIITGGSLSAGDGGILQKRSEIKRIRGTAATLEETVAGLETSIRNMDEEIQRTRGLSEEMRERAHAAEIERVSLEAELKGLSDETARLSLTLLALGEEIEDAGKRLGEISAAKAGLSNEREALEGELSGRDSLIAGLKEEIVRVSATKDALSDELTEAKVSLAKTAERFSSLERQLSEREALSRETSLKVVKKNSEIEGGRAEAGEKTGAMEGIKAMIEALLKEADGARREEVVRAEALTALTGRLKAIDDEIRALRNEFSELEELKGELTIELKETELGIRHLKDRVIEKYGVDIETYAPSLEATSLEAPSLGQEPLGQEPFEEKTGEGEKAPDSEAPPAPRQVATGDETASLEARREDLKEKISSMGEVSLSALEEYNELEKRHDFLLDQQADLTRSVDSLHNAILRINRTTREMFRNAFEEINSRFKETFPRFFNGGRAELRLSEEGDVLESGIEIVAQPPGKRLQTIGLLSGGEKALTAISLIFSIFFIKPSPFCLLDEVDAPLDDANIDRFNIFVREMSAITQFLLITHNKRTMEMADALHGVTMEEAGVSKIVSVRF